MAAVNIHVADMGIMGRGVVSTGTVENALTAANALTVENAVSVARAASVARVVTTAIARKRAADATEVVIATVVAREAAIKIGASAPESVAVNRTRRAAAVKDVAETEIAAKGAEATVVVARQPVPTPTGLKLTARI